jgi:hypothetical protein
MGGRWGLGRDKGWVDKSMRLVVFGGGTMVRTNLDRIY